MINQNLLVITGNQLVHKYFLSQLSSQFKLSAVFIEKVTYPIPAFKSDEEKTAWKEFYLKLKKTEEDLLQLSNGNNAQNNLAVFDIEKGWLNKNKTIQLIQKFKPAKIIIFGTSLLEPKYIDLYPDRILNLHVGLSQYYRGSSCNFWPIYDLKPQLLGATVHFVSKGIDDGNIVTQSRITLDENDSEFILMAKPIILGTKLMIEVIKNTSANLATNEEPQGKGSLYLIKDFTPQSILKVKRIVSTGKLKQKIALENKILKQI